MDIFSPTIIDNAIITGSNNASLLQVSSPSATSAFFISGSGRVGIGTTSPLSTLTVEGGNINIGAGRGIGGNFVGTYTSFITYHSDGLGFLQSASFGFRGSAYVDSISYPDAFGFGTNDLRFFTSTNGIAAPSEIMRMVGSTGFVGIGETSPSAKLEIRGSGATSATTALRVENSAATALLTMLNDGTSAFNTSHLYVSSSGRVGVGTTTPRELLHVGGGNLSLDSTRYIDFGNGNSRINDLGLVSGQGYSLRITTFGPIGTGTANSLTEKLRLTGSGSLGLGTDSPSARFHISGGFTDGDLMRVQSPTGAEYFFISASGNVGIGTATPVHNLVVNGNTGVSINAGGATFPNIHRDSADGGMLLRSWNGSTFTNNVKITPTTEVGIGTTTPTAELHISGASNITLLRVGSPTNSDTLFVNGNGRVGINTTSSAGFLGGNISTFTIFQNSGSGDGLTPSTGLQIVNSGSSTSAQAQLSIVTVGDKFAAFNIGTSGSGTQNNYWHLSKRNAAGSHALNLYNNNQGSFSGTLFSFISAGTSTLGENNQIRIDDANGRVGLQVIPTDTIHLSTDVGGGNYIRIDATSIQAPPLTTLTPDTGYGITTNKYYLAEPDYWMEIKLDGNIVLIPCYVPA
jgi:hypothetical protein